MIASNWLVIANLIRFRDHSRMINTHVFLSVISIISHVGAEFHLDIKELETEFYDFSILNTPVLINKNNGLEDSVDISSLSPSDLPPNFAEKHYENHILVGNRFGRLFYCGLPRRINKTLDALLEKETRRDSLAMINESEIVMVLSRYLRDCIRFYNAGWWTYEFCFLSNKAHQFHMDEKTKASPDHKINLGHALDPDKVWNVTDQENSFVNKNKPLYYSKFYAFGDACSVGSKLRETEVRFYCDDTVWGAELKNVEESETCSYVFHVHVKALCKIPAFASVESKPIDNGIICLPALNEPDMKEYKERNKKRNERAAKKKSAVKTAAKNPLSEKKIFTLDADINTMVNEPSKFLRNFESALDKLFLQATTPRKKTSEPRTFKAHIDDLIEKSKRKKKASKDSDTKLTSTARTIAKLIKELDREIEISDHLITTAKGQKNEVDHDKSAAQAIEDELADGAIGDHNQDEENATPSDFSDNNRVSHDPDSDDTDELEIGENSGDAVDQRRQKSGVFDSGALRIEMSTAFYDKRTKKIISYSNPAVFSMQKFLSMLTGSDEVTQEKSRHKDLLDGYQFDPAADEDE